MPALRKTLILANLVAVSPNKGEEDKNNDHNKGREKEENKDDDQNGAHKKKKNASIQYRVEELALASEHAPFRLRNRTSANLPTRVGAQKKRKKAENINCTSTRSSSSST
jgi:hypothetical protein